MDPLLTVSGLTMDFGGIRALDRVDFCVFPGEIVALIGPNGAGKTTVFNCLTGMHRSTSGQMVLTPTGRPQRRLHGLPPHRITAAGLARTFQNIRLFPRMSVLENVMVGRHCRTNTKLFGAIFRPAATVREEKETIAMCLALLGRVGLADQADEVAQNLPYGAQRRLEIARALATDPQLLLLDEPAAGMNPQETVELEALIVAIRNHGLSILLIEHDMKLVMRLAEHIFVMDHGRLIAKGTSDQVRRHPAVIQAYLGEEAADA
ncbi:MAG: ABC transporter ATP-binding protein [Proteobacteria bacterium]|nr:ABC transporter ATP-binding protein [Pseudomonadota bacterium]